MAIYMRREPDTTIACDFRAGASWETTTINDILSNDWLWRNNASAKSAWTDWRLRLSIPATDKSAWICLWWWYSWDSWWITNGGFSAPTSWSTWRKQNLIKKAYVRIAYVYITNQYSWVNYGTYNSKWPYVNFQKKLVATNWRWYNGETTYVSRWWFVFRTSSWSSWSSYANPGPNDPNTQYLALPSHPNTWTWVTSSDYIDQWQSCLYSRLTLETRWTDPSNFHYRLIVDATGNEYDCWLCTALWPASLEVASWDWRCSWSYKEIDEAYIEFFNNYYIDETGAITTTKPW